MLGFGLTEFSFLAVQCVVAFILAAVLSRQSTWSKRRITVFASALIPAIVLLLCLYVLADSFLASMEECGVDACAMAAAGAMFGIVIAMLLAAIGVPFAWAGYSWQRR